MTTPRQYHEAVLYLETAAPDDPLRPVYEKMVREFDANRLGASSSATLAPSEAVPRPPPIPEAENGLESLVGRNAVLRRYRKPWISVRILSEPLVVREVKWLSVQLPSGKVVAVPRGKLMVNERAVILESAVGDEREP